MKDPEIATCVLCGEEPVSMEHLEEAHLKHGEIPGKGEVWVWDCPICEGNGHPQRGGNYNPVSASANYLQHIHDFHGKTGYDYMR